ncbi:condensation domain-containing protein [Carnobacterium maltaromaticum]|uniref:condensation domain-containing protein n=1 Tax=Carnobacterium maltaromaticum TaxID=2751 RepID=UPI0039BDD338
MPDAPNLLLHEEKANKSKFERKEYIFSSKDLERLQQISKTEDCSTSSILLAIYSLTLQKWSENDQFTINMTTFKRPRKKKYLEVIGDFTSTTLGRRSSVYRRIFWRDISKC